jgi:hypothetical protein
MTPLQGILFVLVFVAALIGGPILVVRGLWALGRKGWKRLESRFPPKLDDPIELILKGVHVHSMDMDGDGFGSKVAGRYAATSEYPAVFGKEALHVRPVQEGWKFAATPSLEGFLAIPYRDIQDGFDAEHFIVSQDPLTTLWLSPDGAEQLRLRMGRP